MKVFLDTNVFYNDWFMKNANFKYLFHFLNNEGHDLILSQLVIEETENIRNRQLAESLAEIKRNIKKVQKLNPTQLSFDQEGIGIENYELSPLLHERIEYIKELNYDEILQSEVVKRALQNKKPFLEGEKGYRDTLIWLSFLNYLVKNDIDEEVVFITENKSDFFKIKDKVVKFHQDLENDISEKKIKAKITPFTSLFEFVNSTINKDDHAIDHYHTEEIFEEYIEHCGSDFLEGMTNIDLSEYFDNSIFETKVKDILEIRADVLEGLEDPEVMSTHRLEGHDVYVSYRYNLRRVFLDIDIPEIDYTLNKDELMKIFYDIEVSANVATLSCCVRPYFDVSFIFNTKDESLKNYEVSELWLRL